MRLEIDNCPQESDIELLISNLVAYNKTYLKNIRRIPLATWCRDDDGAIIGGVSGSTFGKWLEIKYLWVDEVERQKGIGSSILKAVEEAAISRNCLYALVDTYDFQAKPFYIKNGYMEVCSLNEYPISGKLFYLAKHLHQQTGFTDVVTPRR